MRCAPTPSKGTDQSVILDCLELMLRQYHPLEFATLCVLLLRPGAQRAHDRQRGHLAH